MHLFLIIILSNILIDFTGPKATITATKNPTNSASNTITITFDEDVNSFTNLSFTPATTGATLGSVSGGPRVFTGS
jgi:hypothetical protein